MALTAKKVYAILKRQISDMEAKIKTPIIYRGTVATADLLPLNPDIGDMYNIESKSVYGEAGMNVAWNGVVWDTMGAPIDMSLYIKSSELADWAKQQNKPTYTAEEVGALPDTTVIPSKTSELQNDSGFLTKIPDNYLSGTDKTLSVSGKAADAKATGDKITELSANISNKLNKNQGAENSGKIAGINESGDIVPIFPVGVDYNSETNCLEFGSDQKMELNQGIGLDSTLTKTGSAADAGATGKEIASLKEDISNKITKFYASSQGETHLADSDNGKIMDMMLYGKSEQKQYSGKNLLNHTLQTTTVNGVTCTNNGDGTYTLNGTATADADFTLIEYIKISESSIFGKTVKIIGCPPDGDKETKYSFFLQRQLQPSYSPTAVDEGNGSSNVHLDESVDGRYLAWIRIISGYTCNNLLFKPMIVDASLYPDAIYDDFEPYTGGIPSPNPDYPQEIKSVVNPTVKVCGKNLLDVNLTKANINTKMHNGVVEQIGSDTRADLQWKIIQFKSNGTIIDYNEVFIMQGTRFGCAFTAAENTTEIVFGLNGEKTDTTVRIPVKLKVGQKYVISCNLLNSTQGSIKWDEMMLEEGFTITDFKPYHEQTVTLPYTLNAIPVNSGGNVTIDGQQYIADYVDVERGKLVRMAGKLTISKAKVPGDAQWYDAEKSYSYETGSWDIIPAVKKICISDHLTGYDFNDFYKKGIETGMLAGFEYIVVNISKRLNVCTTIDEFLTWFNESNVIGIFETPEEIDLTPEEIAALKALATYYPTTNISVNSEQLDGYTVFNYPVSMENGWNYVKQQIGDTRDYIYDMDARTQDTDLQAAEAYVNSEYAVALTELEV